MWCIPPKASAEFLCHMEDVLNVYHRPCDPRYPVACLDETSKQLIGEAREPPPPAPGRVERYAIAYVRNGVAKLFLAFEPLAGWRHVEVTDTRTRRDWAHSVRELVDGRSEGAQRVGLVVDQLNAHSVARLYEAFTPAEAERVASRLGVQHRPKHGSRLNMAESELSVPGRDLADRVGERPGLVAHVSAWEGRRHGEDVKADWQFTTADARVKLRKLHPTIDD